MESLTNPGGDTAVYSIAAAANATSYTWALPAGARFVAGTSIIGTSVSVIFESSFTSGNISVIAKNNCASSIARTLAVSRLLPTQPGTITATELIGCPYRRFRYSLAAMPANAVSLTWTVPIGAVVDSVTNSGLNLWVTYNPTGSNITGIVSVMAVNNCSNSLSRTLSVTVLACTPPPPTSLVDNNLPIVKGTNVNNEEDEDILKEYALDVSLFPNPSADVFSLKLNGNSSDRMEIRVYDISGRLIEKLGPVVSGSITRFGSKYRPGLYYLEVSKGSNRRVIKLIKS
jgi:hypothetical protein